MDVLRKSLAPLLLLTTPVPVMAQDHAPVPAPEVLEEAVRAQAGDGWTPEGEGQIYLKLIAEIDDATPALNAVIAVNQDVWRDAFRVSHGEDILWGRTVLVKDNIEVEDWPTTAGSLALAKNTTGRDAPLITRLRANGGVVLGKTNLSQWANFRSSESSSGWSSVEGQTKNPHATDRSPCGSSSGSAVAVAAGMGWAAIGTETNGSITCPASVTGIVGFKPTVGLVSRTHIIPISASQDTAGPMARNVADAALLLNAIAGSDPLDPATAEADARKVDYTEGLVTASLDGVRIGVMRKQVGDYGPVTQLFEQALSDLRRQGAVLVDVEYQPQPAMFDDEYTVLLYEFREGLDAYLAGTPADIPIRSLDDLIRWNAVHALTELRWFGQDILEESARTTDRAAYETARANSLRMAGAEGIDRLLAEHDVAVLIAPTTGPAWPIDLVLGDRPWDGIGAGYLAAITGYPHLTVPMGHVEGLPVGLSFMGPKWADHDVLKAGAAYEFARSVPLARPSFKSWSPLVERREVVAD